MNNNPTGINQYTGKGGRGKVHSRVFEKAANGRKDITIGDQVRFLKKMRVLAKTPMPGARGYTMANPTSVAKQRSSLAATIKLLRKSK